MPEDDPEVGERDAKKRRGELTINESKGFSEGKFVGIMDLNTYDTLDPEVRQYLYRQTYRKLATVITFNEAVFRVRANRWHQLQGQSKEVIKERVKEEMRVTT